MSEYDHNDKAGNEGDLVKHFVLTYAIEAWLKKVNEAITNNNQNIKVNYFDVFSANAENKVSIKNGAWKNGVGLIPSLKDVEKTTLLWQQIYQMWGLKSNLDTEKEETKPSCRNYPGSSVFANQVFGINKDKIKKINIFANDILPECAQNQNAYFAFYNKDGRGMHFDECRFTASISDWKDFLDLHFSSSQKKDYARDFVVIDPPNLNTIVDLFNENGLIELKTEGSEEDATAVEPKTEGSDDVATPVEPNTEDPADRAKWNLNNSNIFIWIPLARYYTEENKSLGQYENVDEFHNKALEQNYSCLEFLYGKYDVRSTFGCRIYLKFSSSLTISVKKDEHSSSMAENVLSEAKVNLEKVLAFADAEVKKSIEKQTECENATGIIKNQLNKLKKDLKGTGLNNSNEVFKFIEENEKLLLEYFLHGFNSADAYSALGQEFAKNNRRLFPIGDKEGEKPVSIVKGHFGEIQKNLKLKTNNKIKKAYMLLRKLRMFELEIKKK